MGKNPRRFFSPWGNLKIIEIALKTSKTITDCSNNLFHDQLRLNYGFKIFAKTPRGFWFEKSPWEDIPVGKNQCLKLIDKLTCFYILIRMLNI